MTALRFSGPFGFLAAIPVLYWAWPAGPLFLLPALLSALLLLHAIPDRTAQRRESTSRLLPLLYIPLQLSAIAWGCWQAARGTADPAAILALAVSIGVCGGVFGLLGTHEAVHSRARWHRILGALMLTGIGYPHFSLAHLHGHHRFAASDRDPSAPRLGESFFAFLGRTVIAQAAFSWRFEQRRLRHLRLTLLHNRVARDGLLMAALYSMVLHGFGASAVMFFALQSGIAIATLELFNYIAHYGLNRRAGDPLSDNHSWNSSGMENLLLFNMGHHSAHHRSPAASYDGLCRVHGAPELPGGYAGAILLALVPPLWRRVMHPKLAALGASAEKFGYGATAIPAAAAP